MKKKFVCCLLSLVYSFSIAQTTTFQKMFGGTSPEGGFSFQQTNDGGFVIAGFTNSFGGGDANVYFIKTDSNGILQWTKTFGGTNNDYGHSTIQTTDGGYIIVAETNSFGAGDRDVYLIKTDSGGNLQWSKTFGGTDQENANYVQQTNDGGFIISGFTYSFGSGYDDFYLIKTSSDGSLQWTKTFGGTGDDDAYSLLQTNDGGFILSGWTNSFGSTDAFLLKTMSDGNLQWAKTYSNHYGGYIQQTTEGGFIIGCTAIGVGAGNGDMCLLKITSDGSFQWSKAYGGSDFDFGGDVIQTTDGGFILYGNTYSFATGGAGFDSDSYLLKTDLDGNLLWSKNYGGTCDDFLHIKQINDGFMGGGSTCSFGTDDMYMVKMDSTGSSGCNEGTPNTIVTNVNTVVTDVTSQVQVSSGGVETTPLTIVGSGGAATTICSSTVGVEDVMSKKNTSSKIYPNPNDGTMQLNYQLGKGIRGEVTMFDVFGKTVANYQITGNDERDILKLSEAELKVGIYFYSIKINGELKESDKIIIIK